MPDEFCWRLHSISVVVTAQVHNPSILNPDFLSSHGIVPKNWTVTQTLTTPAAAVVKYTNGIAWTVDQLCLTVTENSGPAFGASYRSHGLVRTYLERLPYVPYRALGLNCQVSKPESDPRRWLVERFAADWLQDDPRVRGLKPSLALDAGNAVCNITLGDATVDDRECVFAECNVHHEGPLNVEELQAAIARWPEHQEFIVSALGNLLGSNKE